MKVLVTGGTGYIGSHTAVELLNANHEVVLIDNYSNSKPAVRERIEEITGKQPTFYHVDILNTSALSQVFQQEQPEAVIHFAAYKAVGESVEQPLKYYHNNVEGTVNLLKVMEEYGVKQIVFSSSATVYGLENPVPFTEDMPANTATNPYGYTKIINEHILQDVYTADNRWHISILRYFNPIGAHESGLIGEDPNDIPNNLMPYITQVAIGKRDHLSIFGSDYDTPDGTGVRDYIHVVDLAQGHVKALEAMEKQAGVHIYNLGTGQGTSVLDLVHAFEKANKVTIPYKIVNRRAGDIATSYADVSLAKKELNWQAKFDVEAMCRDSWRWQTQNPNGYEEMEHTV